MSPSLMKDSLFLVHTLPTPGVSCAEQGFVTIVYLLWHLCPLAMSESSLGGTNRPFANSC